MQVGLEEFCEVLAKHQPAAKPAAPAWESDAAIADAIARLAREVYGGHSKAQVASKLKLLDRNSNGLVSRAELEQGLRGLGTKLQPLEMSALMQAFDRNRDGQVRAQHVDACSVPHEPPGRHATRGMQTCSACKL